MWQLRVSNGLKLNMITSVGLHHHKKDLNPNHKSLLKNDLNQSPESLPAK